MAKKSEYKDSVNIAAVERTLRLMETICYEDREMGIKEIAEHWSLVRSRQKKLLNKKKTH